MSTPILQYSFGCNAQLHVLSSRLLKIPFHRPDLDPSTFFSLRVKSGQSFHMLEVGCCLLLLLRLGMPFLLNLHDIQQISGKAGSEEHQVIYSHRWLQVSQVEKKSFENLIRPSLIQGGPLPVISGVITPISRVITPVTYL